MENIGTLFFDVRGTVFDWKNTVRMRIRELADEMGAVVDSEAFANDWRAKMFRIHTQVRQGNLPWMNSDAMHLKALQAYLKAASLLGLEPSEAMMVAAHEGDLAAAQSAGLHTAYVGVPEEDNVDEGFEQPDETNFDIEARNFESLCEQLKV